MSAARWRSGPRIDLLPLLDVVFLVLTVFLYSVATTVRAHAVAVDLPRYDSGADQDLASVLVVTVRADGAIEAWGEELGVDELARRLRTTRAADPRTVVLLNAAVGAAYRDVAVALDAVRVAGQERVLLAGTPGDGPTPR